MKLILPLNNVSVYIADDEGSFQFSPVAEFSSSLYVYIAFVTDTWSRISVLRTTATVLKTFYNS